MNYQTCVCCGRLGQGLANTDSGPKHFDCWAEHHSGPDAPWPTDHKCALTPSQRPTNPDQ